MLNQSGVNGVGYKYNEFNIHCGYTAKWTENYKPKSKTFLFSIHGIDDALAKATEYRDKMDIKWDIQSRRRILGLSTVEYIEEEEEEPKKEKIDKRKVAAEYYQKGEHNPNTVARMTGLSVHVIRSYFKQFAAGASFEKPAPKSAADRMLQRKLISRLFAEGVTPSAAAEHIGAPSEAAVRKWYKLLKAGISLFDKLPRKNIADANDGEQSTSSSKRDRSEDDEEKKAERPAKRQRTLEDSFGTIQ